MPSTDMPMYRELLWPTLLAIRELGGSGTIKEINERVIEAEGYTEEQQAVPHKDGPQSEIEYRLAWARTNLKGSGAIDNSQRGVWSVTEAGRSLDESGVFQAYKQWRAELAQKRREASSEQSENGPETDEPSDGDGDEWKDTLVTEMLRIPPDAFERLAKRLLREAGFLNVSVTGKSGDGGIDGVGVYRPTLVSFPVYFQCKRYKGSVGAGAVRDFRGAMVGRGEKGLLITTGSFTREAAAEASRDGAPPVELIDGERLCDLLKEYRLGVQVVERVEEDVTVIREFFEDI